MIGSTNLPGERIWIFAVLLITVLACGFAFGGEEDLHTFTGPGGTSLEAEVLEMINGQVKIRRVSDGQDFSLPANRLAPADVEFMRAWLAAREAAVHPLGWKRVRIHLPHFADEVEVPGIPGALRRSEVRTWEGELPEGAWFRVTLHREEFAKFSPAFLLRFDGERDWYFDFADQRLSGAMGPNDEKSLCGFFVAADDGADRLKELKSEVPAEGIALSSEYLDESDFSALGKRVTSAVVGEVENFATVRGAGLQAFAMQETMRVTEGLKGWDELQCLDVRCPGNWPIADAASLKSLSQLVVDGDVALAGIDADDFPALRHLSLAQAGIDDVEAFGDFLAARSTLQSLSLPDDHMLDVAGLANCPEVTVLSLGDGCGDPAATGLTALKKLSVLVMRANYAQDQLQPLIDAGHFSALRTLGTGQLFPLTGFPQLAEIRLRADRDAGLDFSTLSLPGTVRHLSVRGLTSADLAALATVAGADNVRSLHLQFPSLVEVSPLASCTSLQWLEISDQLVTAEEKLESLDVSMLPALRGLTLLRLQNLVSLKATGASMAAISVRKCAELQQIAGPAGEAVDRMIHKP